MKKRHYLFIILCLYICKLVKEIRYGDASDSMEVKTYMAASAETNGWFNGGKKEKGAVASAKITDGKHNEHADETNSATANAPVNYCQSANTGTSYISPSSSSDDNAFVASVPRQQQINLPSVSAAGNAVSQGSIETPAASAPSSAQPQILASLSGCSNPASISGLGGPSSGYSNMDVLVLSLGLFDGGGEYTTMSGDDGPPAGIPFDGDEEQQVPVDGGLTLLLAAGIGIGMRSFRQSKRTQGALPGSFVLSVDRFKGLLQAKLFQVMVCMLPHGKAPFFSGKFSK